MRIPDSAPARRVFLIVSTLILTSLLFAAVPFNVGDVLAGIGVRRGGAFFRR